MYDTLAVQIIYFSYVTSDVLRVFFQQQIAQYALCNAQCHLPAKPDCMNQLIEAGFAVWAAVNTKLHTAG